MPIDAVRMETKQCTKETHNGYDLSKSVAGSAFRLLILVIKAHLLLQSFNFSFSFWSQWYLLYVRVHLSAVGSVRRLGSASVKELRKGRNTEELEHRKNRSFYHPPV